MVNEKSPILYSSAALLEKTVVDTTNQLREARGKYFQSYPNDGLLVPRLGVFTSESSFDEGTGLYVKGLLKQSDLFLSYLDVVRYDQNISLEQLLDEISDPRNKAFDGLILTLPLPPHLEETPEELIKNRKAAIEKIPDILDIDGMKVNSFYPRPTPYAIRQIMHDVVEGEEFREHFSSRLRVAVVGLGQVGLYLCDLLEKDDLEVYRMPQEEIDEDKLQQSNVIICTARGVGVIKPEHINADQNVLLMNAGRKEVDAGARQRSSIYVSDSQIGQVSIAQIYANAIRSHIQTRLAV